MPSKSPKAGTGKTSVKWAQDLKTLEELEPYLCDAAFEKKGHQKPVVKPENCLNCEGQCAYGSKYLRIMRDNGMDIHQTGQSRKAEDQKKMESMAKEIKRLEQLKEKAEKKAQLAEAKLESVQLDWQKTLEEHAKASERLMQAEAENDDMRKTLDALVKEKAVMIARLKNAERIEAEAEVLNNEIAQMKVKFDLKSMQLMRLKARIYDFEHPEEV